MQGIPVSFFAIDEAHCISEWGHEFSPRNTGQLSRAAGQFWRPSPSRLFTASATQRVRHGHHPSASTPAIPTNILPAFHRPNLRYVVRGLRWALAARLTGERSAELQGMEISLSMRPPLRRSKETADFLQGIGIPAIAYHGQMEAADRRRNQERWMSDEVRVLVGTICVRPRHQTRPAVRAVIHLSLPKSIEQYYQEAGTRGTRRPAGGLRFYSGRIVTQVCTRISSARSRIRAEKEARLAALP